MPTGARQSGRRRAGWLLGVLILAAVWRAGLAAALPCISRDGVTFCRFARELGQRGPGYLRSDDARQHPLFPALLLAAQRTARALGAPDTPMTWQRCGQALAWLAGMGVVALTGAVTLRLVRRLALPLDAQAAALSAMLLAAVLDLNVWLSADVMSDELHLLLYLAALGLLIPPGPAPAVLGAGALAGLAFLTRPEAAVLVPAGLAGLLATRGGIPRARLAARAALLVLGFVACAAPYWSLVGTLSAKKNPLEWLRTAPPPTRPATAPPAAAVMPAGLPHTAGAPHAGAFQRPVGARHAARVLHAGGTCAAAGPGPAPSQPAPLARLITRDVAWWGLLPEALHQLLRAGRVVVPLLALLPLVDLRRRLLGPVLAAPTTCFAGHLALAMLLLARYGYLHPRHMLVTAMLLVPPAAMLLARLVQLATGRGRRGLAALALALPALPLALYSLRVPNSQDAHLVAAARLLAAQDAGIRDRRLLSGSSGRRIAFYADMAWEPWHEQPEHYAALTRQIRGGRPGYFALELGRGEELAGNGALAERLLHDPQLAPWLGSVQRLPRPAGGELLLIELRGRPVDTGPAGATMGPR